MLFGYRVGESQKVMLPVMIHIDGFILTHVIEPVEFWETQQVESYLPEFTAIHALLPHPSVSMIFSQVTFFHEDTFGFFY